jgi:hypothetical protein
MRILNVLATCVTLAIAGSGQSTQAIAQERPSPEALQAATELAALLSKDMVGQLGMQMAGPIWSMMERELKGQVDAATMTELRREVDHHILAQVDDLIKQWPPIYARHFTAAELREITAFNRSPTGQKALRLMPIVMAEFIKVISPQIEESQQKARQSTERILRERGYIK